MTDHCCSSGSPLQGNHGMVLGGSHSRCHRCTTTLKASHRKRKAPRLSRSQWHRFRAFSECEKWNGNAAVLEQLVTPPFLPANVRNDKPDHRSGGSDRQCALCRLERATRSRPPAEAAD